MAHVDTDGYICTFPGIPELEAWLEPLTEEETAAIFDDDGRFYGLNDGRCEPTSRVDPKAAEALLEEHISRYPRKARRSRQMLFLLTQRR